MEYFFNIDLIPDEKDIHDEKMNMLFLEDSCHIYIGDTQSRLSLLLSDESLYSSIKEDLELSISFSQRDDPCYVLKCQDFLDELNHLNKEEFYNKFQSINIVGSIEDVINYLHNNPELKEKNICYVNQDNRFEVSEKGLQEASNIFEIIKESTGCEVSFVFAGNEHPSKIEDIKKVIDIINKIVSEVKSLNLSPFEETLYVYDIIRGRQYKEEDANEAYFKSRDLVSVLLGDKIVCVGFVNLFNTILKKLNILCTKFRITSVDPDEAGHVQTLVYLIDSKYNIEGLYIYDPTAECKDNDNSYLSSYFYFAKTSEEMLPFYKREKLFPNYKYLTKKELSKLESSLPSQINVNQMSKYQLTKGINTILSLMGEDKIAFLKEYSKKELMDVYKRVYDYFNRPFPIETFIKAFKHVRSLEYYLHPEIFPFDITTISEATFTNSFYKISLSTEEQKLLKVLSIKPSQIKKSAIKKVVNDYVDEKDILKIKLTRQLRNKLNNN